MEEDALKAHDLDQGYQETERRLSGAFFTPLKWAAEARRLIGECLGDGWRDEYVVIDPACGTKNLTAGETFSRLYLSTLKQEQLDASSGLNPEAKAAFAFDFLNGSDEEYFEKAPGLREAIEAGDNILFYMNPPYCTDGGGDKIQSTITRKTQKTTCKERMQAETIGQPVTDYMYQFIYRTIEFARKYPKAKFSAALFTKNWLESPRNTKLRDLFNRYFAFRKGIMIKSTEFGAAGAWPIVFSVWTPARRSQEYPLTVYSKEGAKEYVARMIPEDRRISSFLFRNPIPEGLGSPIRTLRSACSPGEFDAPFPPGAFGQMFWQRDRCSTMSLPFTLTAPARNSSKGGGRGTLIWAGNLREMCVAQAAYEIVDQRKNWWTDYQLMKAPDTGSKAYGRLAEDCLVAAVFGRQSHQSSLRGVGPRPIVNQFFWLPSETVAQWAEESGLAATAAQARLCGDRYMAGALAAADLSPAARALMDKATWLLKATMKYRAEYAAKFPQVQPLNFDCGWWQVKQLVKAYMPQEFKKFNQLLKALRDQLYPLIIQCGMYYE